MGTPTPPSPLLPALAPGPPPRLPPPDPTPPPRAGGLFRLIDYSALPHSLSLPAPALLDSLDSRAALRSALGAGGRRSFHARMRRLVDACFGAGAAANPASEVGQQRQQ